MQKFLARFSFLSCVCVWGVVFFSGLLCDVRGQTVSDFLETVGVEPIPEPKDGAGVLESDRKLADRKWEERVLGVEFRRRMKGRPYEKEALEVMALLLDQAFGPDHVVGHFENAVRRGEALRKKGLNDPYFLGRFAMALDRTRTNEWDAAFYLARALKGYPKTKYSRALECRLNLWLFDMQKKGLFKDHYHPADKLVETAADAYLAALADGAYSEEEAWLAVSHFRSLFHRLLVRDHLETRDRIVDEAKLPEWARNTMRGMTEISKAWKKRGTGFAHTVNEDGWQGFAEHLGKARVALEESWEENPNDPIAPALMIKVVMGSGTEPGESMRMWFDRAIAAQFDCMIAYDSLLWAYRPRWCGSHDLMRAFGLACWRTGRFDTLVPFQLEHALRGIEKEEGEDWRAVFEDDLIREPLLDMCRGYIDSPSFAKQRPLWVGKLATYQWRCGDYEGGLKTLEEAGPRLYRRLKYQLDDVYTDENQLRGEMELGAKGLLDRLLAANGRFAERRLDEAEATYRVLRDECDGDAVPWLESKLSLIRFERDFSKGEWTPLEFDPILGLWDQRTGEWTVDDKGRLTALGRKSRSYYRIVHRGRVGNNFEMRATVHVESKKSGNLRVAAAVGCRFEKKKPRWISCVWSRNRKGESQGILLNRYHLGNFSEKKISLEKTNTYRLRVLSKEGKLSFWINDLQVAEDFVLTPFRERDKPIEIQPDDGVGFVISFMGTDAKVTIEDAEVRNLK